MLFIASIFVFKSSKLDCNEKRIILEGKLIIIEDKYPICAIVAKGKTYWIYDSLCNFNKDIFNKIVKISAVLSPSYRQNTRCNICYRRCNTCQCPMDEELLYDVKILKVLN